MNSWWSRHALIWMIGSLILLLAGLVYWNVDHYQREKASLAKEIGLHVELAYGEVRDSILQKFVRDAIRNPSDTALVLLHQNPFFNLDGITNSATDSIHIHINSLQQGDSMIIANREVTTSSVLEKDSTFFSFSNSDSSELNILSLVNEFISRQLEENDLPRDGVSLVDTFVQKPISAQFKNAKLITLDNSPVKIETSKSYILQKIWPSMLASLLLFLAISGTYMVIYRAWKEQERINVFQEAFVSNMTHELKTPISTVGVALEALDSYGAINDPVKAKEYIQISKLEIDRLDLLVNKVLKMSQYDNGQLSLEKEKIDLNNLVERVLESMKLRFEKDKVRSHFQQGEKAIRIHADRAHITNVLHNLIDNAIKYSGETPVLNISLATTERDAIISIEDNGVGIPNDDRDRIFDRFYRIPTDDVHTVKGYGLGLHYVKNIIAEHNGNIRVESGTSGGSIFIIQLPLVLA